ncbi:unnamed protein product [Rotaria magnacalcarata]|uniref:Uncharacterized protein n=2 Tax=Rotaria magnacalcarata TaxID=392030 RepID=A0A816YVB3_9BILA|nr:unnamed protein product [Rotaria magnacalcarata]CAF2165314.1 unnamed protein product [Rotaria magnacalcarata]CAF4956405.1 unnamed protein product [Rotaria magnacalcarata]
MFQTNTLIDTSVLPSNIMSLRDDNFIDFVKEEVAGHAVAALLELQGINSVKSLLMTDDVCSIMNVKSKSLDAFKNKSGYMQDDMTKYVDDAKLVKSSKRNQLSSSLTTTTDTSSTIRKPTSSVLSNSSPETISSKSSNLSVAEHKSYIIDTLNNWYKKNKSKDNNERFSLVKGKDYFISLQNDSTGTLKRNIKCSCEKWTSLVFRRGKIQLSNFYRHLQVSSPSSTHNHQSVTTSDNVLQQIASPNSIPIIQPLDTIKSNSTPNQQKMMKLVMKTLSNNHHH